MRIGEVANLTKISVRAIRHYDSIGLLRPHRDDNGYRSFTADDVERVRLIQSFLGIGFRLGEIRDHAPCWQAGSQAPLIGATRQQSKDFLQRKLLELDERMQAMSALRLRLKNQLQAYMEDELPAQAAPVPKTSKKQRG